MSPRKVAAVAWKELLQTVRDPLSLTMLLGVPAFMLLLYGFALNFDVRHVRLAVEDRSKSAQSREFAGSFVHSTYFDRVADLEPGTDVDRLLQLRMAKAVLVIPEDFARDLQAGRIAHAQLLVDGSDASTATTLIGYAAALAGEWNVVLSAARSGTAAAPIRYQPRVWFNPGLSSTQFLVPGLFGFILMLTGVLSTALSVVREKERGTLEQLRVTSLRPGELILGKSAPYLVISLASTVIILITARVLFGVEVKGSYLDLFLATLVYLLGALGLGLLVSSIADTQAMAFQIGALVTMLPAMFLSGFIFPIRSMPRVLQLVTYAVPARYFLVCLRGVILKGTGLAPYRSEMAFLVLYALVVLGIAYLRLVRREA